jgi:membrane fusion protein
MSGLFREEVVSRRAAAVLGESLVVRAGLTPLLTGLALTAGCALVVLAWAGSYTPKSRVLGQVVPEAGLVRVVIPRDGVVLQRHVAEGDAVRHGQALLSVGQAVSATSGTEEDAAQLDALMQEHRLLSLQFDHEQLLPERDAAALHDRLVALEARRAAHYEQQQLLARRIDLLEHDVERLDQLRAQGHLAATVLDARTLDLLDARAQARILAMESARMDGERASLRAELDQLPLRAAAREAELRARLLAVERSMATAEVRWTTVIRAPVDGTVALLSAAVGAAVRPGHLAAVLSPSGSRLSAELLVPVNAVAFVEAGDAVRLRYDAYPFQKFGLYGGTVRSISEAPLQPEDQPAAVRMPIPAYRLRVALDAPSRIQLRPGMTLQADLLRDRRRIIEWLVGPVYTARAL